MAKGVVEQVRDVAIEIIRKHPQGITTGTVIELTQAELPSHNPNTIATCVAELYKTVPNEVVKPERGVLKPASKSGSGNGMPMKAAKPLMAETLFYDSFALWLKDGLDEVTYATALGGAGMKTKWGTPDVVGVYRSGAADIVKFPQEVVSAEIKTDAYQPVVAFGQATAYRLFSTKSYVVLPTELSAEDLQRTESLCMLYGIGLVLFDLDPAKPGYQIRVRAQRFSPDMFYVNDFAHTLRRLDERAFNMLFG